MNLVRWADLMEGLLVLGFMSGFVLGLFLGLWAAVTVA